MSHWLHRDEGYNDAYRSARALNSSTNNAYDLPPPENTGSTGANPGDLESSQYNVSTNPASNRAPQAGSVGFSTGYGVASEPAPQVHNAYGFHLGVDDGPASSVANRISSGETVEAPDAVIEEDGRSFHGYRQGRYFLPNDGVSANECGCRPWSKDYG
ncbi:uncharacterized protein BCR38DRAFT_201308 [Pseudomassariella vexata]|uniref:Uncharacterized protein n=1 Tax=Pseudomassariella vexata TaxID=1141098 RepID=A0A1Y2DX53_9PEZI|nr:uncharacterized protein BCR38DRAFT_201308 [Pseudomassariella vexata]ORY63851.1 hypothetical protein BCR38DRAFT_201308 [Pseudomassariella vexata]